MQTSKSSASNKRRTKKAIAYIYLEPANKQWLQERAIDLDQPFSYVIDQLIGCARKGEKLKLEKKVPVRLKLYMNAKEKRIEKLKAASH